MAARSVLVSIAVLVICPCYGCSGGRGTEGQPGTTQVRRQWDQDKP